MGTDERGDAREGGAKWSSAPRRAAEHAVELLEAVSGQIVGHVEAVGDGFSWVTWATWISGRMEPWAKPSTAEVTGGEC